MARGKPHPDVHLEAASRLAIAPRDCVVLEDSFNGVRAAHAAGAMTIMVADALAPTDDIRRLCVAVTSSLDEVKDMLGAGNDERGRQTV